MPALARLLGAVTLLAVAAFFAAAGLSLLRNLRVVGGYQDSATWVYLFVGGSELLLASLGAAVATLLLWSRAPPASWAAVSGVAVGASLLPYAWVVGPYGWVANGLFLLLAVVSAARYGAHRARR